MKLKSVWFILFVLVSPFFLTQCKTKKMDKPVQACGVVKIEFDYYNGYLRRIAFYQDSNVRTIVYTLRGYDTQIH